MRKLAVFFCIFILFSEWEFAQEQNQIPQEPIKKIETPNGSPVIEVAAVRGYLVDSDDKSVQLLVNNDNSLGLEIRFADIETAYKLYNQNNNNHHKPAIIAAAATGTTMVVLKVSREDNLGPKDLITDYKIPIGAMLGYGIGYLVSKRTNSNKEETPFQMLFYDAAKNSIDELAERLKGLKKDSELEFVLKQ